MALGCRWQGAALLLLVCSSAGPRTALADEPEVIEIEDDPWAVTDVIEQPADQPEPASGQAGGEAAQRRAPPPPPRPSISQLASEGWRRATWSSLTYEIAILAFVFVYAGNTVWGRRKNGRIARAWAEAFCMPGGILDRNFAMVGTGDGRARVPLTRESGSEFTLYCSGRRYCRCLRATLDLRRRQDLFLSLLGLVFPWDDKVDIEVVMADGAMPPIVLAIATKKLIKAMLREEGGEDDIRTLARKMDVSREKAAMWPSDKLVIYAEHSSIFYDIMSDNIVNELFSRAALESHGRHFRQLHFTSEQAYGPKDERCVLRFSFGLPAPGAMDELTKLMSAIGVFIDAVGGYKLSPDMRKRAEKLRQDVERKGSKDKDTARDRQEALEERRMAKRVEEQERVRRMTPEQREKYEQRKAKIESGRQQRKFVRRG